MHQQAKGLTMQSYNKKKRQFLPRHTFFNSDFECKAQINDVLPIGPSDKKTHQCVALEGMVKGRICPIVFFFCHNMED